MYANLCKDVLSEQVKLVVVRDLAPIFMYENSTFRFMKKKMV